ncbi:uncharacterized protein LOC106170480 isoform X2 [Lingula anatina]|uniref:Uncharacterized protein LOC106170480 isoform X2 n=1 Tax=Lingula anatina TaxID=7574 RepID=A0A1S3J7I0_LINAN|nr:uncharacterized protein LOC106170480 isoform X2 [Lingula anatina]|eukprot:XP_013405809.1 uncharacterized protein LOC106170480 isoform X2 [Lingula anatina]
MGCGGIRSLGIRYMEMMKRLSRTVPVCRRQSVFGDDWLDSISRLLHTTDIPQKPLRMTSNRRTRLTPTASTTSANQLSADLTTATKTKEVPEIQPRDYKLYSKSHIPGILNTYLENRTDLDPLSYVAAASVLPMRTNNYVVEDLIDWSSVPNDPIFQLVFPQPGMLSEEGLADVRDLLRRGVTRTVLRETVEKLRAELNPHPANQKTLNVPRVNGQELPGMQHKYRETVLFFPSEGQFCQAFCTYCFRWAQFTSVGSQQQFQSTDGDLLRAYLRTNKCVSDVLFTGGDPMVMTARQWQRYLLPLINDPTLDHVATVRIGTKSIGYWPYRYISDSDSDDILWLLERVVKSGKHLAIMSHFSHPRELSTPVAQEAIRRIQMTGATIRAQAPLIRHVNDNPQTWADMWRLQVRLGIIPYYMFVERDTGAKHYFEVPLAEAVKIYQEASSSISGIGRTVRGPSMSASPGKLHVLGTATLQGEKVFVLKFLQGRNPAWTENPFFAQYDPKASWLSDLRPAFGEKKFFFEDELEEIERAETSSGALYPYPEGMEYKNMML